MRVNILPLALLGVASVAALDSFQEYIEEYLPSCVHDCTITAAESQTNCGEGSVASTSEDDVSCLCSSFTSTDVQLAQDFANSLTECILSAGCSDAELEELQNLDALEILSASDELCGEGTADSVNGDTVEDENEDDGDDGDNGATTLVSGSSALLAAGFVAAVAVF